MDAEKLTTDLFNKMNAEQHSFHAWLIRQDPDDILSHAAEYAIRDNILTVLTNTTLDAAQADALLSLPKPLSALYDRWCELGFDRTYDVFHCLDSRANDIIQHQKELAQTPVYKASMEYAKENDEVGQHDRSHEANIACKEAIEKSIALYHRDMSFDTKAAVKDVVEKFGYERTLNVLAATVRHKDHDGRFSNSSKNWARSFPLVEDTTRLGRDYTREFVVQSHPALVEGFVTTARHEHLLSLPLTKADIKAEAERILGKLQNAHEPNSPNGTHYMAQISPDFLARAKTKDTDRLMAMLPFKSLSFSTVEGQRGTFALISKDEDRFQKLVLRKPSVRKKLQEYSAAPKPPAMAKAKEQER